MAAQNQAIPASLAALTGVALLAVFIAPFYGALEPVIDDAASGQSILVEDFDYTEPDQIEGQGEEQEAPQSHSRSDEDQSLEQQAEQLAEIAEPETASPEDDILAAQDEQSAHLVAQDQPMQMVHGAIAVAAGRVEGSGYIITLADIVATEVNEQCRGDDQSGWNCGIHARTAFRSWLGSKTLQCRLPEAAADDADVTTDCLLGNENAAQWLVRNGWVKAAANGAYAELGKEAETAKRGIWGHKPVAVMPELAPLSEPSTLMPAPQQNSSHESPSGYFPPAPQN